jgi:hypothetical protein
MSRSFTVLLGGVSLVALLVAYKLMQLGAAANARDAVTTASSEAVLAGGKAYRARIAQLTRQSDSLRADATRLRTALRTARTTTTATVARVRIALPDTALQRQLDTAVAGERRACEALVENCDARVATAERRAGFIAARLDSVETQLAAQVLVGSCRINLLLWKPACPSRFELFVIGVLTGGSAALVLQ